jgi:hypothetical protein
MKKGRAYTNIHAILNKYTWKRMGCPQTTVKGERRYDIMFTNIKTSLNAFTKTSIIGI